ncbi:MAG: FecR domain-containing protein [Syntrophorhabdaceae bacterium]|nr:FecR domain-containing protein [Syntrophorhabdaceae bacterium]
MKKAITRTITAVFIFFIVGSPLWASSPGAVYLNSVEGSVQYLPAGSPRMLPAAANRPLAEGDTVMVAASGNAEIFIRDGSLIRIAEGSRLKVLSIERTAIQFFLESGKAHVNFKGLRGYPLFISTPSAQLDALERSTFRMDVNAAGETEISVFAGELFVAQPKGKMNIIAGTRLIMKKDGKPPVYTRTRPADAWDKWNQMKDGSAPVPLTGNEPSPAQTPAPAAAYPEAASPPVVAREYVYVSPAPVWGYYGYWGYRPYPWRWHGPYYRGWGWHGGYRGYYGSHRGYRGYRGHSPRRHGR